MLEMPDAAFEAALDAATGGAAGTLKLGGPRVGWPLQLGRAERVCGPGWVLVGDAAHTVHPLSGQGLNLGLGDVEALVQVIAGREPWRALSDEKLLRRYARARAVPVLAMQQLTDGLLHLFAHEAPALRELRNHGLNLVNHLTPLKRWLTGRALGT
jgi:2-polyprenyl-6-methoxyphenol hydroxylase-like FAD-dependent oxidoreductase